MYDLNCSLRFWCTMWYLLLCRYLLIEGESEMAVKHAKKEVLRVLNDETMRVAGQVAKGGSFGKYSVI